MSVGWLILAMPVLVLVFVLWHTREEVAQLPAQIEDARQPVRPSRTEPNDVGGEDSKPAPAGAPWVHALLSGALSAVCFFSVDAVHHSRYRREGYEELLAAGFIVSAIYAAVMLWRTWQARGKYVTRGALRRGRSKVSKVVSRLEREGRATPTPAPGTSRPPPPTDATGRSAHHSAGIRDWKRGRSKRPRLPR